MTILRLYSFRFGVLFRIRAAGRGAGGKYFGTMCYANPPTVSQRIILSGGTNSLELNSDCFKTSPLNTKFAVGE